MYVFASAEDDDGYSCGLSRLRHVWWRMTPIPDIGFASVPHNRRLENVILDAAGEQ
jgi:hypothetical protein